MTCFRTNFLSVLPGRMQFFAKILGVKLEPLFYFHSLPKRKPNPPTKVFFTLLKLAVYFDTQKKFPPLREIGPCLRFSYKLLKGSKRGITVNTPGQKIPTKILYYTNHFQITPALKLLLGSRLNDPNFHLREAVNAYCLNSIETLLKKSMIS